MTAKLPPGPAVQPFSGRKEAKQGRRFVLRSSEGKQRAQFTNKPAQRMPEPTQDDQLKPSHRAVCGGQGIEPIGGRRRQSTQDRADHQPISRGP